MTIDFTGIKGVADDYGNVTKITDALGNVLWNAVKLVNLTITSFWDGMDGDTARITINSPSPFAPNPNEPNNKVTSWTAYVYDLLEQQNRTIKIPVGSTIECYITRDKGNADSYIKLNDVKMATGEGTYVYTVIGDATIDVSEDYIQGDFGVISIVGAVTHISFTMNDETYQAIEGMSWKAWFASSYNTTGETKGTLTDVDGNEIDLNTVIMDGVSVLWSAAKPVTVTFTSSTPTYTENLRMEINGKTITASANEVLTVNAGTKITFYIYTDVGTGYVHLNGNVVMKAAGGSEHTYEYYVNTNISLKLIVSVLGTTRAPVISITEIPEGHALLTLETSKTKHTDVVIDGTEYSVDTTLVVPIGKVVSLRTTNDSGREDSYISINGTWVCSGTTTLNYEYVVVGNATICTYYSNDSRNDTYGYIEITEN